VARALRTSKADNGTVRTRSDIEVLDVALLEGTVMANEGGAGPLDATKLVDTETVANLLGVGERYVRRLVAERQIEFIKVGHYVRFDLKVVGEWVADRRHPAESPA
jgi:excisionase family DNA binding protein